MWRAVAAGVVSAFAGGAYAVSRKVEGNRAEAAATGCAGNLLERFGGNASVGNREYMTLDDFISSCCSAAVLARNKASKSNLVINEEMQELFKRTDADGDGLISFSEYCVLFTFLSVSDQMFRTAFHMFDRDLSGSLDFKEFEVVMKALCVDPTAKLNLASSGFSKLMFGNKLEGSLKVDDFLKVVQRLRWDVRGVEFEQFAEPRPSALSSSAKRSSKTYVPSGKVSIEDLRNLLGMEYSSGDDASKEGGVMKKHLVSWQTYAKLFDVILEAETIERALSMLTDAKRVEAQLTKGGEDDGKEAASDFGATRPEFARALRAAKLSLSAEDIEVFYKVFDVDGSGTIDPDEFGAVCRLRSNFYAAYVPRYDEPKRNAVQAFVSCMQQRQ